MEERMAVKHYTGVQGVVKVNNVAIAVSEFTLSVDRGTASHPRSGKWSDLNAPGKVKVTGTVKRIMVDSTYLKMALASTGDTGDAESLVAADTIDATSAPVEKDDIYGVLSAASNLRVTHVPSGNYGIDTAGAVTLIGTGADGNPVSETILIPVTTVSATWDTQTKFLQLTTAIFTDVECSATGATLQVDSLAGITSFTVGTPTMFSLTGKLVDGADYIQCALTNCWWKKGTLGFTDADKMVEEDMPFEIEDPDADIIITGT
jgi:hypothetical protein